MWRTIGCLASLLGALYSAILLVLATRGLDLMSMPPLLVAMHTGAAIVSLGVIASIQQWRRSGHSWSALLASAPPWAWFLLFLMFAIPGLFNMSLMRNLREIQDLAEMSRLIAGGALQFYGASFIYYWKIGNDKETAP